MAWLAAARIEHVFPLIRIAAGTRTGADGTFEPFTVSPTLCASLLYVSFPGSQSRRRRPPLT
jgi:hypothetical protein